MSARHPHSLIHRRELLAGAGAAGLSAIPIAACGQPRAPATSPRLIAGTACPATPRQTEGPFYFDPRLVRADMTEGRPGVPLALRLQVVDADGCALAERARVDVWHCDAAGAYSGYERERTGGETWLRGTQIADQEGIVAFRTVYPGWYQGRAPHIHFKSWLGDGRELTSQLYFPDALSDRIYANAPYAGRGGRPLRNAEDGIFRRLGGAAPMAEVRPGAGGYEAAMVIALA